MFFLRSWNHIVDDVRKEVDNTNQSINQSIKKTIEDVGNTIKDVAHVVDDAAETAANVTGVKKAFEDVTGLDVKDDWFHNGFDVEPKEGQVGLLNNDLWKITGKVQMKSGDGDFGFNTSGNVVVDGIKVASYSAEADQHGVSGNADTGLYFSTDTKFKSRLIELVTPDDFYNAGAKILNQLNFNDVHLLTQHVDTVFKEICGVSIKQMCHIFSYDVWFRIDGGIGVGLGGTLKGGMDTTVTFTSGKGDTSAVFKVYGCSGACPVGFFIGVSKGPVNGKKHAVYIAPSVGMKLEDVEVGVSAAVDIVIAFDDDEPDKNIKNLLAWLSCFLKFNHGIGNWHI